MSARDEILGRVRRQMRDDAPLPALDVPGIRFDDPEQKFAEVLKSVGGETLHLPPGANVAAELRQSDWLTGQAQILSAVPEVPLGNVEESAIADPHQLAPIDVAIVRGALAVAENGAVWVPGRNVRERALCFLAQRLLLIVPRAALVHNMHEAYAQLNFADHTYGVFISGPSKTADIEQSLVIGAHGPRAHLVVLTGDET